MKGSNVRLDSNETAWYVIGNLDLAIAFDCQPVAAQTLEGCPKIASVLMIPGPDKGAKNNREINKTHKHLPDWAMARESSRGICQ